MISQMQSFFTGHPFSELAFLIAVVIGMSYVMKLLKQPLLIWYIISWILIWPSVLWLLHNTEQVQMFSHLGVALLLFMVWLWLNPALVKDLGKASLVIWVWQVIFTTFIWFFIAWWLWFDIVTSMYISIALAFSSTIIIIKLLSDKGSMDELYGKISVWMLIVQDIIAMIILMILSSLPSWWAEVNRWIFTFTIVLKIIWVILFTYLITKYVLPRLVWSIAKSTEFLLIFAIWRCLIFAAGMELIWFSLEIWALLAWLTLASLPYRYEISSRIKPLRDFFIMVFFVFLWSQLSFGNIESLRVPIIVFSVFVLIWNPFIVMVLMWYLWYKKKNWMMVWFTVAQISEFSFILMGLWLSIWHITDANIVSMVTLIGLITIAWSSYYFTNADYIFTHIKHFLWIFERKNNDTEDQFHQNIEEYDVVVFWNHRTWAWIVNMLIKNHKKFIIIDYDPQVIDWLMKQNIPCQYADASDDDMLEELQLWKAKMIISTIHDFETSMLLVDKIKDSLENVVTIFSARNVTDAEKLYSWWINYVIIPHVISGHHTAMLIESYEYDMEKYAQHKRDDYNKFFE
jgi:Kef-type K+ transport system membrane component KefB